jgi:hypothetical protein
MLQAVDTVMYLVTALVLYHYAGPDVKSPAISSAGPLMRKVCWGLAIPTVRPLRWVLRLIHILIHLLSRLLLQVSSKDM